MDIKRITPIEVQEGRISFRCTSELYGTTDAGGLASDALTRGCVPLGDGCDYILSEDEKDEIQGLLACSKDGLPPRKSILIESDHGLGKSYAQGKTQIVMEHAKKHYLPIRDFPRVDAGTLEEFRRLMNESEPQDLSASPKTYIVDISYYFDVTPDNIKTATFEFEAPSKNRAVVLALRKWPNSTLMTCKEKD